jgi:serine/threonine protein kinase
MDLMDLRPGLRNLHSKGFVHFDIKGNNIRLNHRDDSVYLIDFGLAEPIQDWETGEDLLSTRVDLRGVFKLLKRTDGDKPWLDAFWNDVMHSQRFPYDDWFQ